MNEIETRLKKTLRDALDPIGAAPSLPDRVRSRARTGRALAIAATALGMAGVIAAAAVAVPSFVGDDARPPGIGASSPFPLTPKENGRIAYSIAGPDGIELHTVRPDGTDDRVVPVEGGDPWLPSWSPDGNRLAAAVFQGAGPRTIWVMDGDGSDARQVGAADNVSAASWSPDGRTLAYAFTDGSETGIRTVGADGSGENTIHREAAEGTYAVFSAQFSPDGTKILFDGGTDTSFDIFVMDADGRNVRQLTSSGTDYDPSWSPDGTRIAFTRQGIHDVASSDIFVMNADGSNVARLTESGTGTSLNPQWSPDGTKIAFSTTYNNTSERLAIYEGLAVVNADGSSDVPDYIVQGDVLGLAWQPIPVMPAATESPDDVEESVEETPAPAEGASSAPTECPESLGHVEWTSEEAFVASGTYEGTSWVLCARTAMHERPRDGEGLCMNFLFGTGLGSGMNCGFQYDNDQLAALDADYYSAVGGPEGGYLYGAVPAAADSVTWELQDGTVFTGTIYPAPEELGVAFRFFTVFGEPWDRGTLVVKDEEGRVISRDEIDTGL